MELDVGRDCTELRLAGFKALLANVLSDQEDTERIEASRLAVKWAEQERRKRMGRNRT